MILVHLCSYIQPQLGYQEYYLAKEHAKMGYEVIVISFDRYYPFHNYNNTIKKSIDKIIGVTEGCVNYVAKKSEIPSEDIEMIPLGTDIDLFYEDEKKEK